MANKIFDIILAQSKSKRITEKQQKVIDAAIQLFAEQGYANTSTAEIARVAGVSEGTIFKHYGTKDRLLLSLILPFISELFPRMVQELMEETFTENTTSFEQFFRTLLHNRVQFLSENKEIFQVLIKEFVYRDELRKELQAYVLSHGSPFLKQVIDRFKASGELMDLPTETLLKNLATFIFGFLASRFLLMDPTAISDEEIEDAVQFIMNGLRNPLNVTQKE